MVKVWAREDKGKTWLEQFRGQAPHLLPLAEKLLQYIAFYPSPRFLEEALSIPEPHLTSLLRAFGLRGNRPPEVRRALIAYNAEKFLQALGAKGGILTALLYKSFGGKEEWLRILRRLTFLNQKRPVRLDEAIDFPLWVEAPRDARRALILLSGWAKSPYLSREDREFLYALKDSLMVYLWNLGRLRLLGVLVRRRPLVLEEDLVRIYKAQVAFLRKEIQEEGYEGVLLSPWFPYLDPDFLPEEDTPEHLEFYGRYWAKRWNELLSHPQEEIPRGLLFSSPSLLLPLLNPFMNRLPLYFSWEEVVRDSPHLVDPFAFYLIVARLEGEEPLTVHLPYRKAVRMRLLLGSLPTWGELPYNQLLGRQEIPMDRETYRGLLEVLEEMGYAPEDAPGNLELLEGGNGTFAHGREAN